MTSRYSNEKVDSKYANKVFYTPKNTQEATTKKRENSIRSKLLRSMCLNFSFVKKQIAAHFIRSLTWKKCRRQFFLASETASAQKEKKNFSYIIGSVESARLPFQTIILCISKALEWAKLWIYKTAYSPRKLCAWWEQFENLCSTFSLLLLF